MVYSESNVERALGNDNIVTVLVICMHAGSNRWLSLVWGSSSADPFYASDNLSPFKVIDESEPHLRFKSCILTPVQRMLFRRSRFSDIDCANGALAQPDSLQSGFGLAFPGVHIRMPYGLKYGVRGPVD